MAHTHTLKLMLAYPLALIGCFAQADDTDETARLIDSSTHALTIDNALIPNALIPNALIPNALIPNALIPNALIPNALSPSALASLQDPGQVGELSRMFVKYTVSCALSSSQSFSFSWRDSAGVVHNETYPGQLGVAPEWATGPLNLTGQKLVSSCLAARTNWYGRQVEISMRYWNGLLPVVLETSERALFYPYIEGAFWGNLFAETPYLRACYHASNVSRARAAKRDCAAGHVGENGEIAQCGLIDIVGPCSDHCSGPSLIGGLLGVVGRYYPSCVDPDHGSTQAVMTTGLP